MGQRREHFLGAEKPYKTVLNSRQRRLVDTRWQRSCIKAHANGKGEDAPRPVGQLLRVKLRDQAAHSQGGASRISARPVVPGLGLRAKAQYAPSVFIID